MTHRSYACAFFCSTAQFKCENDQKKKLGQTVIIAEGLQDYRLYPESFSDLKHPHLSRIPLILSVKKEL